MEHDSHPISGPPLDRSEPWMSGPERSGNGPVLVVAVVVLFALAALGGAVFLALGSLSSSDDSATTPPAGADAGVVAVPAPEPVEPEPEPEPGDPTLPPTVPAPVTTAPPVVDLFSGSQAAGVVDQVAVARGADPLQILRAVVYPTYAIIQVQDPAIPEHVDEYLWRGDLGEPAPVRLGGLDDLEQALYPVDGADWTALPDLVASAPQLTGISDGEVTHVIVARPLPFSTDVRMRVFVYGPRSSGFVDADAAGNVIDVQTG
jgi:hypothetical protein